MLSAGQRIRFDAHQAQQPADEPVDLVAHGLGVAHVGRRLQRPDDVQPDPGRRTGGVDGEVHPRAQRTDVGAAEVPAGETIGPRRGLGRRELGHGLAGLGRVALVHPRLEIRGREVREGEAEVGQIALRVDEQRGHAGAQGLLDQHDAEAGLAGTGHAHDHAVSGEIAGAHDRGGVLGPLAGGGVDRSAQEEVSHVAQSIRVRPTSRRAPGPV